jgi:hypothetical protein
MRNFLIFALVLFFIGCSQKPVSYHDQIQPILNSHCVKCHGAEKASGKIVLTSYERVMGARTIHGKNLLVVSGNPSESWLYILSATNQPHFRMPPDTSSGTPLPNDELQLMEKWIKKGAENN